MHGTDHIRREQMYIRVSKELCQQRARSQDFAFWLMCKCLIDYRKRGRIATSFLGVCVHPYYYVQGQIR